MPGKSYELAQRVADDLYVLKPWERAYTDAYRIQLVCGCRCEIDMIHIVLYGVEKDSFTKAMLDLLDNHKCPGLPTSGRGASYNAPR